MVVDILMATYNGEKYLKEQIESIVNQTFTNWRLLIHDDGSTDSTLEIMRHFSQTDKRIKIIEDNIFGLGVAKNFIHILNYSHAEYCMFCDQDDIWLENKIELLFNTISQKNNNIPQAVFSNSYLWNSNNGIISNRNTLTYPRKLEELLFLNTGVQGAAGIFNDRVKDIMKIPLKFYAMHDHVLTLTAITFGEIDYIDKPLMYYRQHDENVTGNAPGSFRNKIKFAIENMNIPIVDKNHYEGLNAFYEQHKNNIPIHKRKVIEIFLNLPKQRIPKRVYLIIKTKFKLFNSTLLLLLKMCLRSFYLYDN